MMIASRLKARKLKPEGLLEDIPALGFQVCEANTYCTYMFVLQCNQWQCVVLLAQPSQHLAGFLSAIASRPSVRP